MIKINEVAERLGISTGSRIGDLGQASAVLKFFGVEPTVGVGGVKTYDEAKVQKIAELRAGF